MSQSPSKQRAAAPLADLARQLEDNGDFARLLGAAQRGTPAAVDGVWGSACALLAAALVRSAPSPVVMVSPDPGVIDDVGEELSLFTPARCATFPAWESDPGERR